MENYSVGSTSILLLAFLLCGCVTGSSNSELTADPTRVRSYTFELEKLKPIEEPFVAKFEQGGKILLFVAADHISTKKSPDLLEHPTLKTIARLFSDYEPGVAVVEGINTGNEISPSSMLRKADECASSNYKSDCGESFFAINLARKTGGKFISGEPDDLEIKAAIVKEGFRDIDLLCFYLIRQIPQYKRRASFNTDELDQELEKSLRNFRRRLAIESAFDLADFKSWYKANVRSPAKYADIQTNDTAPHGGPDASFIQHISNTVTLIRDRTTVRRIASMLNRSSLVLVVYGGSHLITQEPALIAMMGNPTYFNLSDWPKKRRD